MGDKDGDNSENAKHIHTFYLIQNDTKIPLLKQIISLSSTTVPVWVENVLFLLILKSFSLVLLIKEIPRSFGFYIMCGICMRRSLFVP